MGGLTLCENQSSLNDFKPQQAKAEKQQPPAVVGPKEAPAPAAPAAAKPGDDVGPKLKPTPQATIPETAREGAAGSWIQVARKNRHLTFLVKSSTYRGYYYEVQSTPKGLRCGGPHGPCKAWKSFKAGNIKDPCRHVLIVKDRLRRGLVQFKGRAITSLQAFRELLISGMHNTDMSQMLGLVLKYPDRTAIELWTIWNAQLKNMDKPGKRTSTAAARVSELYKNGFIEISGRNENPDSEQPAYTWRVAWEVEG
jgi:hypothetical protein